MAEQHIVNVLPTFKELVPGTGYAWKGSKLYLEIDATHAAKDAGGGKHYNVSFTRGPTAVPGGPEHGIDKVILQALRVNSAYNPATDPKKRAAAIKEALALGITAADLSKAQAK